VNSKIQIYKVGGAVRDKILGIESNDTDYLVVGASERKMFQLGFIKVGKSFPVYLDPETKEEYALARIEKKIQIGYAGFECDTQDISLEEDLRRRDLTINAMVENEDGEILDFFNGISDLKNGILRHISSAFREDSVRVLRLARFQAIFPNFIVAPETQKLVLAIRDSGELDSLKKERINIELKKMAVKSPKPYIFFKSLKDLQVLDTVFPFLDNWEILKDFERLEYVEIMFLLSISTPPNILLENIPFSKVELKKIEQLLFLHNLLIDFTIKDSIIFFKMTARLESLDEVLVTYKNLYPIDLDYLRKMFIKYKESGKMINCLNGKRNKMKIFRRIRFHFLSQILKGKK